MHHTIPPTRYIALLLIFCCTSCSLWSPEAQNTPVAVATSSVEATPRPLTPPDASLAQALQFTPADADSVAFTNWTLVKAYADATDLTGRSDLRTRIDFHLNQRRYALDFTLAAGLFIDTTVWSFDSVDMLWEARIDFTSSYSNSTHLFMFPPTFDLSPVIAHFNEYGYQQERYHDTTIYTRQPDFNAPWYKRVPLEAIFHAAVLPHEHLLIFGATREDVQRVLDVQQDRSQALGDTPVIRSLLQHLGTAETALLLTGSRACKKYLASKLLGVLKRRAGDPETATALEQQFGPMLTALHPYAAFGYSFRLQADEPLAVTVFEYTNAQDAQTDYATRHQLAVEGRSLTARKPYKDSLFTVRTTALEDQSIILQLDPYQQRITFLFDPISNNDLLFAACPG